MTMNEENYKWYSTHILSPSLGFKTTEYLNKLSKEEDIEPSDIKIVAGDSLIYVFYYHHRKVNL